MDFPSCLKRLLDGKKCRRESWGDDPSYITIEDRLVTIWRKEDEKLHPLILSVEDMLGTDWVVGDNQDPRSILLPNQQLILPNNRRM